MFGKNYKFEDYKFVVGKKNFIRNKYKFLLIFILYFLGWLFVELDIGI